MLSLLKVVYKTSILTNYYIYSPQNLDIDFKCGE